MKCPECKKTELEMKGEEAYCPNCEVYFNKVEVDVSTNGHTK